MTRQRKTSLVSIKTAMLVRVLTLVAPGKGFARHSSRRISGNNSSRLSRNSRNLTPQESWRMSHTSIVAGGASGFQCASNKMIPRLSVVGADLIVSKLDRQLSTLFCINISLFASKRDNSGKAQLPATAQFTISTSACIIWLPSPGGVQHLTGLVIMELATVILGAVHHVELPNWQAVCRSATFRPLNL